MNELNTRTIAKSIKNISNYGIDVGVYFNPVGNFSLSRLNDDEWLCYMRTFQYWITSTGKYLVSNPMKLEHPDRHLFMRLDNDFNLIEKIDNPISTYYTDPIFNKETPYLEDGRLIDWNGEKYLASATFYQQNNHYQKFGIEVQHLDLNGIGGVWATHKYNSIQSGISGRQKNWMAVSDMPFNYIIGTSSNGCQVLNIETNKIRIIGDYDEGDLYRGNTNLLNYNDGYFAITHRQLKNENGKVYYGNYIVEYDDKLNVRRVSRAFKMTDYPIEFVTTMVVLDDRLLIGVTAMDDTPEIHSYDLNEFMDFVFE